jgi:hypothetical protein
MRRFLLASVVAVVAMSLISANPASALTWFRYVGVSVADPNTAPGSQPQLLRVTTGHHPTYDRVVFLFSSRAPGYSVRYVSQATADGSGNPVALRGHAFLRVRMHSVASAQAGKPAAPQGRQVPLYPELRALVGTGDFEGYVSYTLGLKARSGFRAFTLTNPDRLVVDVRIWRNWAAT